MAGCRPHVVGGALTQTLPDVPVTEEAAQRFDEQIQTLQPGPINLEVSETEITSYLALRLADSVPLTNPQIHFLPGQIVVAGQLERPFRMQVRLLGTIKVEGALPQVEFQEAQLGSVRVPRFLLASLADGISEMIVSAEGVVQIDSVAIDTGHVTITGQIPER